MAVQPNNQRIQPPLYHDSTQPHGCAVDPDEEEQPSLAR